LLKRSSNSTCPELKTT